MIDEPEFCPLIKSDTPNYTDEAWEIAGTIAAIDKQVLSSGAVEMIAKLASLAYEAGLKDAQHPDSARLNWLQGRRYACFGIVNHDGIWMMQIETGGYAERGMTLRQAIDFAMLGDEHGTVPV